MQSAIRRLALGALSAGALYASPLLAEQSGAQPWDGPSFSANPAAMLQAANAIKVPDGMTVVVLTEETSYTFDANGRRDTRYRMVYRILTAGGMKSWASFDEGWAPWYQDKPVLRARVVTTDGQALELDPATIADSPAGSSSQEIYTDRRVLRAPLPGVGVGAIVEQETTVHETRPVFDAGVVRYVYFGRSVPTLRVRLDVAYPKSLDFHYLVRMKPAIEPRRTEADGIVRLQFEASPVEAMDFSEAAPPPDRERFSYVALATGAGWPKVAARYAEIVDQQIAGADLADTAAEARKGGATTSQVVARLLARLQSDVRYTGVEFSDASIVPRTPAETLKRRYGDCKDKSALLVAMLRAAGIKAFVALLRSGTSLDAEKDLAGLGFFDHAIVYVPGTPALWIDPTDEFARAGELPLSDRGRLALVAAPGSTGLVTTPESLSADNGLVETREFFLQEYGVSRAVVTISPTGAIERAYRRYLRQGDKKKIDEIFEKYVKASLLANGPPKATFPDPQDLNVPLKILLELEQARRGQTDDAAAVVAIMPSGIAESFPSIFREAADEPKPGQPASGSSGAKPRKLDYVFSEPAEYEWIYRVVPPPGYSAGPLPENADTPLATARLTKRFAVAKDGVVTATIHLDTGKARISPKEFTELREAVRKLQGSEAILIRFNSKGHAFLAAGRLREALAEFRGLSCAHPTEAIHAIQTSNALLQAGLGDAAREEARRAISLDAKSARAYGMLAWTLQHDGLGRRFAMGFDRKGALEAYRKSLELDPSETAARARYADLLEYDDRGNHYGAGANLDEAVKQYQILIRDWKETRYEDNLSIALVWSRRFAEALEAARASGPSDAREPVMLLAMAASQGPEAAIREAPRLLPDDEKRRKAFLDAGESLIQMRLYKEAVALMREAANGASNAAAIQARAEIVARARRFEDMTIRDDDPRGAVQRLLLAYYTTPPDEPERVRSLFAERVANEAFQETGELTLPRILETIQGPFRKAGFPLTAGADIVLATTELALEGNNEWGVRLRVVGAAANDPDSIFYAVREGVRYRFIATSRNLSPVGQQVLWLVEKGDLAAAQQWLNWASEDIAPPAPGDPYLGSCLPMFWQQGSTGDTRAARRAAGCLLAPSPGWKTAISILESDLAIAVSDAERIQDEWALTLAYMQAKRYEEMRKVVARVGAANRDSPTLFRLEATALIFLHRPDETRAFAEDRLRRFPNDPWALRVKADLAAIGGDLATYQKNYRRVAETGKAEPSDFNNLAWITLFTRDPDGQGLRDAQKAVDLSQHGDPSSVHTLATLYAESGKTAQARETILTALELQEPNAPGSALWGVFGRIAQEYGEDEVAKTFYERVKPPDTPETEPFSAHALAKKHLEAIAKEKASRPTACPDARAATSAS